MIDSRGRLPWLPYPQVLPPQLPQPYPALGDQQDPSSPEPGRYLAVNSSRERSKSFHLCLWHQSESWLVIVMSDKIQSTLRRQKKILWMIHISLHVFGHYLLQVVPVLWLCKCYSRSLHHLVEGNGYQRSYETNPLCTGESILIILLTLKTLFTLLESLPFQSDHSVD